MCQTERHTCSFGRHALWVAQVGYKATDRLTHCRVECVPVLAFKQEWANSWGDPAGILQEAPLPWLAGVPVKNVIWETSHNVPHYLLRRLSALILVGDKNGIGLHNNMGQNLGTWLQYRK